MICWSILEKTCTQLLIKTQKSPSYCPHPILFLETAYICNCVKRPNQKLFWGIVVCEIEASVYIIQTGIENSLLLHSERDFASVY